MAKRYYWLKLKEDFFDEDTINWIEEQENGKEYVLFYLKLCLKSLKTDGTLIRNVGDMLIPYDTKKLSQMTNTDFDTVAIAMKLFEKIGLIQVLDNGEIFIKQLKEMVGSETDKAALMRKKRANDKLAGNNVTKMLPKCSKNVTQSKSKSKSKSIELDKDKDIDERKIFDYWNSKEGVVKSQKRSFNKGKISTAIKKYGKDDILKAIDRLNKAVLDANYYYSFKWNLFKFLKQGNGISNWLDDGQLWNDYSEKGENKNGINGRNSRENKEDASTESVAKRAGVISL